ncbi:oxidoreductase [Granulosicoccus antarcticus]|uniref:Scyllo-inositol 2-dehydrogenase (NADP(+)) n=1 Tax=Granulosicoccus antarcticus IMCC3135 TaxID=1192854 RepID=A0A2Z2NVR0_9GAMM|nr:oxidoreductase [Granulosicoccus antarcticus]ASJ73818.1 scyllo-inositol 2-dehydrogenase (NADP(+)) [Granulosicoccus antarcticus IMCC3135]
MNEKPLRIGLVGYGLAGKVFHTPLYQAAGVELVAVASSDKNKVHADHPNVRVHATPAELFGDDEVELVVLASPSYTHAPLMLEALAAGKHVLSDKPFTSTVQEADEVIAAAEAAGRIATCYQNRRYDADFLTLRQLIDDGQLGEVVFYAAHFDRFKLLIQDRWQESEQPGVGIHYDLGAHIIDQALALFGMPDWVQGDVQKQREGSDIIDSFHLRMGLGRLRVELTAGMLVADNDLRYRVHGTRGSWIKHHLDPQEDQLRQLGMTPQDEGYGLEDESHFGILTQIDGDQSSRSKVPTLKGDWPAFYRELSVAIRQGNPPPVTALQARNTIAVIEAMLESSRTGRRIELP